MAKKEWDKNSEQLLNGLCNISRDADKVSLELAMPGVSKENLEIRIENDRLFIRGRKTLPEKEGNYLVREIRPGSYVREFTLDDTIDRNRVEAILEKGMLSMTLFIKESEKPRKIQITAG